LRRAATWALAVLGPCVFLLIKLRVRELGAHPFLLFMVIVSLAGWYGGLWRGLGALGLSSVFVAYYFVPPLGSFHIAAPFPFCVFIAEGLAISVMLESLHQIRRRLNEALRASEAARIALVASENELRELHSRLARSAEDRVAVERLSRERTEVALSKSEEQLRQAQKMEAVGSLAGGIAHDFNNLLSVILSYSELLSEDLRPNDPMREDLDEIKGAGLRAVELTRQLLAFSRQQVLVPKIVDLNEIVGGMEKMLRRLIGEDVELVAIAAPSLRRIVVDPGQIEQVIMNLAVNARDAMPQGGQLTIETAEVDLDEGAAAEHEGLERGRHVMLAVSDTGTGMDHATQARIFEPFFTTKDVGKGTGLGLSTVFGITKQSGGAISAASEPGKGTTFTVYFPVADLAVSAQRSSIPPPGRHPLRGSETILLVEDEASVRALARTILRKYGYTVLEAQSGGDALLLCEQHPATIDLLLTDVVMPRMSGRQLAERFAAIRPQMKVLYMSGYTDDAVLRHGVVESTSAFIQKPITPEPLARKLREVLDSPRTEPHAVH
jgi:two-component system cell cycle sensor histidine kinase/response regulator CckA